jgi:glycosyltransferase, MGT family
MARILIATMPIPGHVAPFAPVARQLAERGHEVVWYTSHHFQKSVERTGAAFAPLRHAYDFGDMDTEKHFPERKHHTGMAQIRFDFKHIFFDSIAGMLQDLREIRREFDPHVLLTDPTVVAGRVMSLQDHMPWAILNITVLGFPSRDVAPFGPGIPPDSSPLGRLRNRLLYHLMDQVLFADVQRHLDRLVEAHGWPALSYQFDSSPYLNLQPSVPEFEYPRTDLPDSVHFIGPLLPETPAAFARPEWWDEVTGARPGRPVVLVTQGTVARSPEQLILPSIEALADEDVSVIVATGGPTTGDLEALRGGQALPGNVYVAPFVPFVPLMPHVDAYVTNGGYGGVTIALANGVPVVAGGVTEDKAEVAGRIAYSGVGVNLRTATPTPDRVRGAVRTVLIDPSYRQSAQNLRDRMALHNAAREAADLLETLATTGKPVLAV